MNQATPSSFILRAVIAGVLTFTLVTTSGSLWIVLQNKLEIHDLHAALKEGTADRYYKSDAVSAQKELYGRLEQIAEACRNP